jgi:hypothetical protein
LVSSVFSLLCGREKDQKNGQGEEQKGEEDQPSTRVHLLLVLKKL